MVTTSVTRFSIGTALVKSLNIAIFQVKKSMITSKKIFENRIGAGRERGEVPS